MIKKEPKIKDLFFKKEFYFPSGRSAFNQALKLINVNKNNKILLPSYIGYSKKEGSGIFDQIEDLSAGYEFYKLNKDLSIDLADFEKKIKRKEFKAVLIIHYFGFYQRNFDFALKLCKKYNKFLIEDCAHAFISKFKNKKLGTFGDISFYSIKKFFPVTDGGILRINNDKIKIPPTLKDNIALETLSIFNRLYINKISDIKIKNYNYVLKKIKAVKGLHPFYNSLPNGVVPMNFPVIIEKKDRNEVYFKLLEKNIKTVSLYHTLIAAIKKSQYPIPHYISSHILNLLIHEYMTIKDIDYMLDELKKILSD